jgi:hypothetical protein
LPTLLVHKLNIDVSFNLSVNFFLSEYESSKPCSSCSSASSMRESRLPASVSSFFPAGNAAAGPFTTDVRGHFTAEGRAVRPFAGSSESVRSSCSCHHNGQLCGGCGRPPAVGGPNTSFSSSSCCSQRPSSRSSCSSGSSGPRGGRDISSLDYAEMIREGTVPVPPTCLLVLGIYRYN